MSILGEKPFENFERPKRRTTLGTFDLLSVTIILIWAIIAVGAPFMAPYEQGKIITEKSFASPGEVGLMGSDHLGRDVFSRVLFGARSTIGLALLSVFVSFGTGTILGLIAAVVGGRVDGLLSRAVDTIMSFPSIILALIIIAGFGTSVGSIVLTVGLIESTRVFRLSRAVGMDIMVMDYIEVARARGERLWWIIRREILPNAVVMLVAEFGIRFTYAILFISALSFLGLSLPPPTPTWGGMVRENMQGLLYGSPAALLPAAAIASVTIAVNMLVDWYVRRQSGEIPEDLLY